MKPNVKFIIALILFIIAGSVIIGGPVHSAWYVETSPTTVTLYDIWGASQSDIYAVGAQETILHNDGTGWSVVSSVGNGDTLRDVSGNSGSNIYAVGDNGLAKYFDGNSWTDPAGFINTGANLNGVWVSSGGAVFIVGAIPFTPFGSSAVILHYTGTAWVLQESGTGNILEAVWGSSESDVFAVGANGTILHYDGFEWLPMTSNTGNYLTCVWGSAGNDVFASGGTTNIHHYNGSAWTPTPGAVEYPDDLWGSSGSDVYAVGGSDYNKIDHFDGTTWGTQFQPGNHPNGVWGSAKDNVFVVGNSGMIMRSFTNKPPFPPPIDSPADEENFDVIDTIILDGGAYSDPENHLHGWTYFQVKRADGGEVLLDTEISGGKAEYAISPGTFFPGLKYDWQVAYEDAYGAVSWSREYSFKVGVPEGESLPPVPSGTDVGDFGMISIVHWPDNPSPSAVFGIDYNPRNYRIGTYDAVNNRYIEFGNNLEMEPGRSYWILAREGLTINFSGIPVSQDVPVYVALDYNSETSNGWNMVAPPNGTYYWGDVQVVEYADGVLIDVDTVQNLADDNLYIDRKLWRWENGHYHFDTPDTDPGLTLEAYAGYWVKARQANVFLRFDPGVRISSLSPPEILMAGIWKKTQAWFSNLNIFSKEAVAEGDDTPPMPMGGLDDDGVDPVFQGCFIEITRDVN